MNPSDNQNASSGETLTPGERLQAARRLDKMCDHFEAAWQADERPRIEEYLSSCQDSLRDSLLGELLAVELEFRRRTRETPEAVEYVERFPDSAGMIRDLVESTQVLNSETNRGDSFPPDANAETQLSLASSDAAAIPTESRVIDHYVLDQEIGRGAMGVVYRALDLTTNRTVALKVLREDILSSVPGEQAIERFQMESKAAAGLEHDNIISVFEVGEHSGTYFYAMRLIKGDNLLQILRNGPVTNRLAATYMEPVARAVHHAHTSGVLHRDLKPHNILVDSTARPYVTDFGLAKWTRGSHDLTKTGDMLGSPAYMAPEQVADASKVAEATDIYGLGATLYHLLTGRPPFQAATVAETLNQVLHKEPVPPRQLNPAVHRDLETICLKCLQKEPQKRYSTAEQMAGDLRRCLEGAPITARPVTDFERLWRWSRRNPVIAALTAVIVTLSIAGFALVSWKWREAERRKKSETTQREIAEVALDEAQTNIYYSHVAQSDLQYRLNNIARMQRSLQRCVPAAGQTDRRGWEWRYLQGLSHSELLTLDAGLGNASWVYCVAFSPDGRLLAAGAGAPNFSRTDPDTPGRLTVWSSLTGELVLDLRGKTLSIISLAFSPDGRRLATVESQIKTRGRGDRRAKLKMWDVTTGRELIHFKGHTTNQDSVRFSPDGRMIATHSADGMTVWDTLLGNEQFTLPKQRLVKFSSDSEKLTTIGIDGQLFLHNSADGKLLQTPKVILPIDPRNMVIGHEQMVAVRTDTSVELYDQVSGQLRNVVRGHNAEPTDCQFSPDGKHLATAGADKTVRVWEAATGSEHLVFRGHTDRVLAVAFSPSAARLASGGWDGQVKVWDLTRQPEYVALEGPKAGRIWEVGVEDIAFRADEGRLVAVAIPGGVLQSWDAASGVLLSQTRVGVTDRFATYGRKVSFNADGTRLAGVSREDDSVLKVWDVDSGSEILTLPDHRHPIQRVHFSRSGRLIASAAWVHTTSRGDWTEKPYKVRVWNATSGKSVLDLAGAVGGCTGVAISPDDQWLAVAASQFSKGSLTNTLKIWRLSDGREMPTVANHPAPIYGLAFSPTKRGGLLASASEDGTLKLWEFTSQQLKLKRSIQGPAGIQDLSFSPNGQRLAGATRKLVTVWHTETGHNLIRLHGRPTRHDPPFNPRVIFGSQRLAANHWSNAINVWSADEPNQAAQTKRRAAAEWRTITNHWRETRSNMRRRNWRAALVHLNSLIRQYPPSSASSLPFQSHWEWGTRAEVFARRGAVLAHLGQREQALADRAKAMKQSERGAALLLTGGGEYVAAPHIPFDKYDRFTIEAWVRDWTGTILKQGESGDPENYILMRLHFDSVFGWESGRGTNHFVTVVNGLSNRWNHLAMVFDGQNQRIFVNGKLHVETRAPKPGPLVRSRRLMIGGADGEFRYPAAGFIRAIRISRSVRYRAGFTPPEKLAADDDTVLFFDFAKVKGDRVPNLAKSGREGVIENAWWIPRSESGAHE